MPPTVRCRTPRRRLLLSILAALALPALSFAEAESSETLLLRLGAYKPVFARGSAWYVGQADGSGESNLFQLDGDGSRRPLLTSEEAALRASPILTIDPASGKIAVILYGEKKAKKQEPTRILVLDPASTGARTLIDNGRFNSKPAFEPGGRRIAYFSARPDIAFSQHTSSEGAGLRVYDLEAGKETTLSEPSLTPLPQTPPAWSPRGTWIAFVAHYDPSGMDLNIVRPDGTGFRTLNANKGFGVSSIAWLTDSTLFFTENGKPGISLKGLGTERIPLVKSGQYVSLLGISPDRKLLAAQWVEAIGAPSKEVLFDTSTFEEVPDIKTHYLLGAWRNP